MSLSGLAGALVAVFVAGALLAGCGETVIDNSKTEGAIQSNLEKALHEKVSSVSCPSELKIEPGATFTCSVSFADGKHATETLRILNKEADLRVIDLRVNK